MSLEDLAKRHTETVESFCKFVDFIKENTYIQETESTSGSYCFAFCGKSYWLKAEFDPKQQDISNTESRVNLVLYVASEPDRKTWFQSGSLTMNQFGRITVNPQYVLKIAEYKQDADAALKRLIDGHS